MRTRSFALLVAAIGAGGALLAPACLLPDYTVGDLGAVDDGGTPSSETGNTLPDGATIDGTVPGEGGGQTCAPSTGECDGVASTVCETDLRTSNEHCGACNRACGTTQCQGGECLPEQLIGGLVEPMGLELAGQRLVWYEPAEIRGCRADDCAASKAVLVDVTGPAQFLPTGTNSPRQIAVVGQKFFFSHCPSNSNSDCGIAGCDIAGCKLTGPTYVAPAGSNTNRRATLVVAGALGGSVFSHQGIDGLYRTDLGTKTVTYMGGTYNIQDQLQAFYVDGKRALILDDNASQANPTGGLFTCPAAGCPPGSRLLPPPVKHLSVDKDVAYTSTGGNSANASITACEIAGCGSAGTVLAKGQPHVSDIAADGPAVYWATIGAPNPVTNTAAVGTVMGCALPGCPGGPKKLAEGLINPTSVRVDGKYVYWLERGGAGQANGRIMRQRR